MISSGAPGWAPLVHGRTLGVDFRSNLIAVPEGFTLDDLEWAKTFILSTTQSTHRLPGAPRWSLFSGRGFAIAGVTCMAADVSLDMNRDDAGRSLYVFLGYVSRLPRPGIPVRELRSFAPLYQFLRDRWHERSFDPGARSLHPKPYELKPPLQPPTKEQYTLNHDHRWVLLWPPGTEQQLWESAGAPGGEDASLCLGLPYVRDAVATPFTNATAADATDEKLLERRMSAPPPPPPHLGGEPVSIQQEEENRPAGVKQQHQENRGSRWGLVYSALHGIFSSIREGWESASQSPSDPPLGDRDPVVPARPESKPPPRNRPARTGPPSGFRTHARATAPAARTATDWPHWEEGKPDFSGTERRPEPEPNSEDHEPNLAEDKRPRPWPGWDD